MSVRRNSSEACSTKVPSSGLEPAERGAYRGLIRCIPTAAVADDAGGNMIDKEQHAVYDGCRGHLHRHATVIPLSTEVGCHTGCNRGKGSSDAAIKGADHLRTNQSINHMKKSAAYFDKQLT